MARVRRISTAFVFAAVLAGGTLWSSPAEAALPAPLCARLSLAIQKLTALATQYPESQLIARLLAEATQVFHRQCH